MAILLGCLVSSKCPSSRVWVVDTWKPWSRRMATPVTRRGGRDVMVEKKASLMVNGLRFGMNTVGISETWCGWLSDPANHTRDWWEWGGGTVLNPVMVECWKKAGMVWSPTSRHIVSMLSECSTVTCQGNQRRMYRDMRRVVSREVRRATNDWLQQKVS